MSALSGWRPALRIARRDALRSRGRSILVLVMIALPVLGVSAAAVVTSTAEVRGAEWTERMMGAADARVWTEGRARMIQGADPEHEGYTPISDIDYDNAPTEAEMRAVLGEDARLVPVVETFTRARLGDRAVHLQAVAVDLDDPLSEGLFTLESGRLPGAPDEVVVNEEMLDKGFAVGDRLMGVGPDPTIVGWGRHANQREFPVAMGPAAALLGDDTETTGRRGDWLVEAGPVSWEQVRELNDVGFLVTSRAVLADPPDLSSMADQLGYESGQGDMLAVLALIVVMALLEVVLLAGPAFAVGARRHSRTLALIAASGGSPAQARRVILASGLVLGAVAAVVGLVLGVLLAVAVLPLVQRFNGQWFGPLELPWHYLLPITGFGVLSAFLAAVVPAWLASRQDVVAVLAGRRGDRRPRAGTPLLGLVLLGGGIGAASYGAVATDSSSGAVWISAAAVISVLGMILVVPVVVSLVARLTRRLPLTTRYAARDAARHRTRTVPAVAAVAATVAGVVALGIAVSSDNLRNAQDYVPELAMGDGRVSYWPEVLPGEDTVDASPVWEQLTAAARRAAPEVTVTPVLGVGQNPDGTYTSVVLRAPVKGDTAPLMYGGTYGSEVLASDGTDDLAGLVPEDQRAGAAAALREGRTIVFAQGPVDADTVWVRTETWHDDTDESERTPRVSVPAFFVVPDGIPPALGILPPAVVDDLGLTSSTSALMLRGDLDEATETAIDEAVGAVTEQADVYVERGYQRPDETVVILLVLGVLGGVLMLGGTLTATFLALSDARPDLATMSAVGAAPRTRRRVAGSYALVVGVVGALLGAVVGLIPGIAISRPLTSSIGYDGIARGPYLDVPWLLIVVLVLALPLLTSAVVGLTTRSRLPVVARLE